MKKKQIAQLGVTLSLVAAVGVGGTLAALTAKSEVVTNTFTVGAGLHDSDILLDEAPVDPNTGKEISGSRVQSNEYKNLEQGDQLDKDPSVSITSTAADCYVFVLVQGVKNSPYYDVTIDSNWVEVTDSSFNTDDTQLYVYSTDESNAAVVTGGLSVENGVVFDGVKIKDDAPLYTDVDEDGNFDKANLDQIVVKACAVQASNNPYENALKQITFG